MIATAQCLIQAFDVPDEHLKLPFFDTMLRIRVSIHEKIQSHRSSIDLTRPTLRRVVDTSICAWYGTEDVILLYLRAYIVEASAVHGRVARPLTRQWKCASSQFLDLIVTHPIECRFIIPEVLHGTIDHTSLARHRFVADFCQIELDVLVCCILIHYVVLQVVDHV